MPFLKNIRVKTKLITAFIIVALLISVVGIIGTVSLGTVGGNSQKMYDVNLQSVYMLTDMKDNLTDIKADMLQLVYVRDASKKADLEKNIQNNKDENDGYIAKLDKMPMSDESKKTFATFKEQLTQYRTLRASVLKLIDAGNFDEAVIQYQEIPKVRDAMFVSLEKLINLNNDIAKAVNADNHSIFINSNRLILIFMVVGLVIAVSLGIIISNDINVPLLKIVNLAENLAKFDLSHVYPVTRKDEFGKTGGALSKAQENIKELVMAIMSNSQEISASSEELSATVEELSSKAVEINDAVKNIAAGVEETSASAEEINASVEEVDSSINELSQKAMEGSANANKSKEKATEADQKGRTATSQVKDLYEKKKNNMLKAIEDGKVVDNIRVMADTIGGIAEQTNLLALNAAIEAARAGEQGKGFAVVAEEVRKLAEQSSEAVASIHDTIAKVQNAFKNLSENGSDVLKFINEDVNSQFEDFGHAINQYNNDADFVNSMSDQIAAMSEELTATVGQVSLAVQNMAQNSQKSAENTEAIKGSIDETAKAIEQVALTAQSQAELAQNLNEMVQRFKL